MPIYFGGKDLPDEAATSHFMIVGTTGSGKTLSLHAMMSSVLPDVLTKEDHRAVIFDVKQDMVSIIQGIARRVMEDAGFAETQISEHIQRRILILNPFDTRCYAWDMATDVSGADTALQVATILIPEEQSQNRYFLDAARDLLTGVMQVFIKRGGKSWGLGDLVYTTLSAERLRHVLNQTVEGKELIEIHLEGKDTSRSVLSTLRTKMLPFQVVAALWQRAADRGRVVSLQQFLKNNQFLILGNNQAALAPIQAINRVLFQRLTELLLDLPESRNDRPRRCWFFLDEVRKLGKLEGLDDLMTNGRSKGAAVVLGFQDIDGMRHVYGKEVAGEITSMCGSFGVLKVSGAETPKWASELFMDHEVRETVQGRNFTSGGDHATTTHTVSEQIRVKPLFMGSEFRIVPMPSPKTGYLCGHFCSAFLESIPFYASVPWSELMARIYPKTDDVENIVRWEDEECKELQPWEPVDFARLRIPILESKETTVNAKRLRVPRENKATVDTVTT